MRIIRKCTSGLFTFLFSLVILNFAIVSPHSSKQLVSPPVTIVIALVLYIAVLGLSKMLPRGNTNRKKRDISWILLIMVLYGVMLYVFANIYYKSGSDLWTIDYTAKVLIGEESLIEWCEHYYSVYPNNIMLTMLYSLVLRIHALFGIVDTETAQFSFVAVNCLISCITTVLIAKVLYRVTKNSIITGIGSGLSVLFFCFNPYNVWPYSDPFSLWIPVSIVAIMVLVENAYIKIGLLTVLSIFSFQIKPQNSIPVIALGCAAIIMGDKLIKMELSKKKIVMCLSCMLISGIIALGGVSIVKNAFCTKISIDETKKFPYTHWIMMGLNQEARGGYSGEDVEFSSSITDPHERARSNILKAQDRLAEMGVRGYMNFLWLKLNKLCNNGTFDYSTSTGDWYDVVYPEKNTCASPFLRSLFYYDGENYPIYYTTMNILWAMILICCLSASIANFRGNDPIQFWLGVSIIGLFVFELLFEAQARHLYSSIPLFILYGMVGMHRLMVTRKDSTDILCKDEEQ